MTPAEQVLMVQRNRNYDELTAALIRIVELEAELAAIHEKLAEPAEPSEIA